MWKINFINNQSVSELQCKWEDLMAVPIQQFQYILPNKKTLLLEGFESYLCFKEIYKLTMAGTGSFVDTINVLAKYNNEVYQFSYNPIKGQVLQRKNVWGKEFTPLIWDTTTKRWGCGTARSTNSKLWKIGSKQEKASIKIVDSQ